MMTESPEKDREDGSFISGNLSRSESIGEEDAHAANDGKMDDDASCDINACIIPNLLSGLFFQTSPSSSSSASGESPRNAALAMYNLTGDNQSLIDYIRSNKSDSPNYTENIITIVDSIITKGGLISTIYLPTSKTTSRPPAGKKCTMRSKQGENKVEISVRIGGELKKFRFDWTDVYFVKSGRERNVLPPPLKLPVDESLFLHIKIQEKGECEFLFDNVEVRDAMVIYFNSKMAPVE